MSLDTRFDRPAFEPGDDQKAFVLRVADRPQALKGAGEQAIPDPTTPDQATSLALAAQKQFRSAVDGGTDKDTALSAVRPSFIKSIEFADKLAIPMIAEAKQRLQVIEKQVDAALAKRVEADGFVDNALGMIPKSLRDAAQQKLDAYRAAPDDEGRQKALAQMDGPFSGLAGSLQAKAGVLKETEPWIDEDQKFKRQRDKGTDARQTTRLMYAAALRESGHQDEAQKFDDEFESLMITGWVAGERQAELDAGKQAAQKAAEQNPLAYAKAARADYDDLVLHKTPKSSAIEQMNERFEQAVTASDAVAKRVIPANRKELEGLGAKIDEADTRSSAASGAFYGAMTNLAGKDVTTVHDLLAKYQSGDQKESAVALRASESQYPQLAAKMKTMEKASQQVDELAARDKQLRTGIEDALVVRQGTRLIYAKTLKDAGNREAAGRLDDEREQIARNGKLRSE